MRFILTPLRCETWQRCSILYTEQNMHKFLFFSLWEKELRKNSVKTLCKCHSLHDLLLHFQAVNHHLISCLLTDACAALRSCSSPLCRTIISSGSKQLDLPILSKNIKYGAANRKKQTKKSFKWATRHRFFIWTIIFSCRSQILLHRHWNRCDAWRLYQTSRQSKEVLCEIWRSAAFSAGQAALFVDC